MDKEETKIKKAEVRVLSYYMLIVVVLSVIFVLVTIALGASVGSWLIEAWGFAEFLLPLYIVIVWRKMTVTILRRAVEE